ncbi:MAG TPA: DNA alkylation repair protein [Flavipsychrobacter sp.]|nr:DNA alkylation repair protein [Flavipsychrobacter sp.]
MKITSSKAAVADITGNLLETYRLYGAEVFVAELHKLVLKQKVRFPVLEHSAMMLYQAIPAKKLLPLTDKIISLHEIGSYVYAGIILQEHLDTDLKAAISKAMEYIIEGDEWYVCDIIGERVMGYALLTKPGLTIPLLKQMTTHESKWIVRCVGVATHYAVKKGLKKEYVETMFQILLSQAQATEFHTKTGIGWGAKTVAKFHPGIISKHKEQIAGTKQWFKTKVDIGLSRTGKYANRYNS